MFADHTFVTEGNTMQAAIQHQYVTPAKRSPKRTPKRVRRARTLRLLMLVLVLVGLVVAPRTVFTMGHTEAPAHTTYTVAESETLWEIASRYSGGQDVRDVIYAIKQANHLKTATVQPGQTLVIPQTAVR
jgi:LysM repeat protein